MLCQSKARGNEPLISHFQTNSTTSGVNRLSKGQEPKKRKRKKEKERNTLPLPHTCSFRFMFSVHIALRVTTEQPRLRKIRKAFDL